MRRISIGLAACLLAAAGLAQTPPRATVILGAGRAGTWDTRISITNVDFNPITVTVTTQLDRSVCGATCNDLGSATIANHATFVLPSIPVQSIVPQAIYVLSPADQKTPAVSAIAYDAASSCGRTTTLQVLSFEDAFNYGDILFPGISRGNGRYVNLLLTLDPAAPGPKTIGVEVQDASGTVTVGWADYDLAPGQSLLIVDLLGTLGIDSLEGGSLWLSRFFIPNSYDFTKYAATVTMVEPERVSTVKGTLDPRSTDPQ